MPVRIAGQSLHRVPPGGCYYPIQVLGEFPAFAGLPDQPAQTANAQFAIHDQADVIRKNVSDGFSSGIPGYCESNLGDSDGGTGIVMVHIRQALLGGGSRSLDEHRDAGVEFGDDAFGGLGSQTRRDR